MGRRGCFPVHHTEKGDGFVEKGCSRRRKTLLLHSGFVPVSYTHLAYQLALRGYKVDVFEKLEKSGGMMRYGIPAYRLPEDVLAREIALIEGLGVNIHTQQQIDDAASLLKDYAAVYVATGCSEGIKLSVPGESLPRVHSAIDFLFALNSKKRCV